MPNPVLVRALERIFILHADHEQNASTATVRLAGSSGANPFACVASGIAALWGPAHGGANEAALNMLEEIGDVSRVKEYVQGVKDKKYRLMGFGHRVYKNMDPRASVMRQTCYEVLKELKLENNKLFELAMELERVALSDPYFIERKLYPNVDFYSGIVLRALGIPTNMFTVIFALARTIGWVSQWNEMVADVGTEDRPPAPVVSWRGQARLRTGGETLNEPANFMRLMQDSSLLFGTNAPFVEELYEQYLIDPNSVPKAWRSYFDALQSAPGAAHDVAHSQIQRAFAALPKMAASSAMAPDAELERKQVFVLQLINAHRFLGVRVANLDPLARHAKPVVAELDPAHYGLSETDMDTTFDTGSLVGGRTHDSARDPQAVAPDLLRQHRRGIHVHQRCGAETLDTESPGKRARIGRL